MAAVILAAAIVGGLAWRMSLLGFASPAYPRARPSALGSRFRITAVDGRIAGSDGRLDAFRIELWRAGTLVFDTQTGAAQDALATTEIGGGNIQIHRE
jgi:hypothetical protein